MNNIEAKKTPCEYYEWDSVWWEQNSNDTYPRALYIGDSISCETRREATAASEGEILFDGFGTSKALDNPYFPESLVLFGRQQRKRNLILFNNGLHGWHLEDETEYMVHYKKMLSFLREEFPDTPVVVLLTTSVWDEKLEQRVIKRNESAKKAAEEMGLAVVDFYSLSREISDHHLEDGIHFSAAGYKVLAEYLVNSVREILKLSCSL